MNIPIHAQDFPLTEGLRVQSLHGPAKRMQTRHAPHYQQKVATLDAGRIMAMIRGQQGSPA